ncbi:MAG: valine--tRNA ligase, partial [Chloroflexi bacterium]|nr:valine--tRNA ligase [Chloroflexota bacterium]
MESVIEIIRSIRNTRAEHNVDASLWVEAQVYGGRLTSAIAGYLQTIQSLARARPVTFLGARRDGPPPEKAVLLVLKEADVVIPLESMVDLEAERKRLQTEMEQIGVELARLQERLKNKDFLARAPAAVVDKERQKLNTLTDKLERLKQQTKG